MEKRWAIAAWLVNLAVLLGALGLYVSIDLPGEDERTGYSGLWRWAYDWQQGWGAVLAAVAAGVAATYTILQTKRIARLELEASRNRDELTRAEERLQNIRNHQRQCSLILRKLREIEGELNPFYQKLSELGWEREFNKWRWSSYDHSNGISWHPSVEMEKREIWDKKIAPLLIGVEFERPPTYSSWLNCHQNQNAALGFDDEMIDLCDQVRVSLEELRKATPYSYFANMTPRVAFKWLAETQSLILLCESFLEQLQWQLDVENAQALPYRRWLEEHGGSSEVFFESLKSGVAARNKRPPIRR